MLKKFNVTFTEKSKYNPIQRTVMVEVANAYDAKQLIHSRFGSLDKKGLPTDKIKIDKVSEVK